VRLHHPLPLKEERERTAKRRALAEARQIVLRKHAQRRQAQRDAEERAWPHRAGALAASLAIPRYKKRPGPPGRVRREPKWLNPLLFD
jgi:hypothetical protein